MIFLCVLFQANHSYLKQIWFVRIDKNWYKLLSPMFLKHTKAAIKYSNSVSIYDSAYLLCKLQMYSVITFAKNMSYKQLLKVQNDEKEVILFPIQLLQSPCFN